MLMANARGIFPADVIHEGVYVGYAAIGANGHTYAVKYETEPKGKALEAKELAEHAPDEEGARFPINMLFVECRGNRARVLVNAPI